jgi:hypothetical protein
MTLSVSRLYNVGDKMVNDYGAGSGIITVRRNQIIWGKPAPVPL